MWGDAVQMAASAKGGQDTFMFKDTAATATSAAQTVGTQNFVEDFSLKQHDQIQFSGVAGVTKFTDLQITTNGTDTIITAGADQVTLVGFTGTLTAKNVLVKPPSASAITQAMTVASTNNSAGTGTATVDNSTQAANTSLLVNHMASTLVASSASSGATAAVDPTATTAAQAPTLTLPHAA
jgi:hypothetical protein